MRLHRNFFTRDVLEVAPDLLGKVLVRQFEDNTISRWIITETEAYKGEEDRACHASKGRTPRTEVMYRQGGYIYVYLIYGMYWLLNIVTGKRDQPQAVLIRGLSAINGPGRIGKQLNLDQSFYEEDLNTSRRLWLEKPTQNTHAYKSSVRIGIDYAPNEWRLKPWRFSLI
ncbi:MAG: DNA-3-methyladenine glycosylase [Marinilabiliaceae bacterium]|nr:DNA-3-methyladenine glycosylase [Marinilabiliaceae bacterium]